MNGGAFGENFPYANFHELNMDWIIKIIKDFKENYPNVVEELNKKLSKPLINPDGSIGNVLVSNGDGTTSWQNVSEEYAPIIVEAVNEWLDEHPEATTTVQDNSLTAQKLTEMTRYVLEKKYSGFIAPVYVGDYMIEINYLPSAAMRVGNNIITVDAPTRNYATEQSSGRGYIKQFSLTNNNKTREEFNKVGHGNSLAYDGTYFYVAPIWDYSDGGEFTIRRIYKYDSTFALIEEIETPLIASSVSYDPITEKLYIRGEDRYIYLYENGTFTLYTTIDIPADNDILNRTYNQDMAIYNDEFYISSPYGNIIHGKLTPTTATVSDSYYISGRDSTGRFILGELEGMEFTPDGHLYAMMYSTAGDSDCRNAFVVELPVNIATQYSAMMDGTFTIATGTVTLSEETQASFHLNTDQIRSINQLGVHASTNEISRIYIPGSNHVIDPWFIKISQSIMIELAGHYECQGFDILSGIVVFYGSANNQLTLTASEKLIYIYRSAIVGFAGGTRIHCYTPNMTSNVNDNFIAKALQNTISYCRLAPDNIENKIMKMGGGRLYDWDIQMGNGGILSIGDGITLNHITGFISSGATELKLYATTSLFMHDTVSISGTVTVRGTEGYLNGSQSGAVINLEGTDHNITLEKTGDYTLTITIKNKNGSAFTNITNNTPIVASGTIRIK